MKVEPRVVARVCYTAEDTGIVFKILSEFALRSAKATNDGWLECTFEAPADALPRLQAELAGATAGRVRVLKRDV